MKRINILMACAALTMAFTGCDDDDDPIMLVDSGMTDTDAGMTDPDPDAGTDPEPRECETDPEPRECEEDLAAFPPTLLPRCTAETKACIEACDPSDQACPSTCVAGDTHETVMEGSTTIDCNFCLGYAQNFCIQENGGNDVLDALNCCIADSGCTTQACAESMCAAEYGAVYSTSNPAATACLTSLTTGPYAGCFAAE